MDKNQALKALAEQQAKERAERAKELEASRPERAWRAAKAEQDQPIPPHPPGMTPKSQPLTTIADRHAHNFRLRDEHELKMLDQNHAAAMNALEQQLEQQAKQPNKPEPKKVETEKAVPDPQQEQQLQAYGQAREAAALRRNNYPKPPAPPKQPTAEERQAELAKKQEQERSR